MMVSSLIGHCQRLGQLDATARCCHHAHRNLAAQEAVAGTVDREQADTEISVATYPIDEASVTDGTDTSVGTIDTALVECISTALVVTRGRIYGDAGAAKLLGLKPSTLQSKMRKLGIERARFVA
jgi:transcriptional regulator with GAF, ATPase, and Fis domain